MKIVRVALAVPLPRLFDYLVPDDVSLQVGMRVLVPFGTQKRVAIVADFPTKSDVPKDKLKAILQPLDLAPLFYAHLLGLASLGSKLLSSGIRRCVISSLACKIT